MRATEFIIEAATDTVYHYTSSVGAAQILRNQAFKLSIATGNPSEESYAPKGYPYFFSTSRSKVGDYHRYVGSGGVMFVLDGQWLSQRYPVKPIDYWERAWQSSPDRSSESEDRVFSKTSEIPLTGVKSIHVLLTEQHPSRSALSREILILSRKLGIPAYFYTNEAAWRLQRPEKAVSVKQSGDLLKGPLYTKYTPRPVKGVKGYGRSQLVDWLELIQKPTSQPLSDTATRVLRSLRYYGEGASQLKNELINARKPNEREYPLAVKIISYMTKNNLNIQTLVSKLKDKWENLT